MLSIDLERVPFLADLPRLTRARLMPQIQEISLARGDELPDQDSSVAYIIYSGVVDGINTEDGESLRILTLTGGDVLLDRLVGGVIDRYVCSTDVTLLAVPRKRLDEIIKHHPALGELLQTQMAERLRQTRTELVRVRRMLVHYARELWGQIPEEEVAAATIAPPAMEPVRRPTSAHTSENPKTPAKGTWWRSPWFAPVGGFGIIFAMLPFYPPQENPALFLIAIFLWAGVNWAVASIPDHVVAIAAALACAGLGLSTLEVAFGGFATGAWWLLVAVLGLVAVVTKTGVLYRMALSMLHFLPPTYSGQMLALSLTGLVMTPCLPNTNVRVSILGPLAAELSEAVGFAPRSKGSLGLAMAAYLGGSQSYFLFLNGATMGMLMWGILPPEIKDQVTWSFWLISALPMALTLLVGFLAVLHVFYRPTSVRPVARSTIALQRAVLGPLSRQEWFAVLTLGFLILAFVTEPIHGISATWLVMAAFLFAMGSGLLDKESLRQIDWSLIFYMGAVISLSTVAGKLGMNETLSSLIAPLVTQFQVSPGIFLIATALLTIVLRLAVPPPVVTVVLTVALTPIAQALSMNPFLVGLVVVAFCSSWLVPQQWSVYMNLFTATSEKCFSHDQARPLAWANNALLLLGLIVSLPFWSWLGLMP